MPTTSVVVDNELLCIIGVRAADKARDLNYVDTPLLKRQDDVHGEGKPFRKGGSEWVTGLGTGTHSNPTRHRTGFEQEDLSFTGVLTPAVLGVGEVVYPIGISATEEDIEADADAVLELAETRTRQVMSHAKRQHERQMLRGGVPRYEDFMHLNGVDDTTDGYLEEQAAGSQGSVIGGFSKATWAAIEGASNQSFDFLASANTRMFAGVSDIGVRVRARAEDPTAFAVLLSQAGMVSWKRIVQANEIYTPSDGKPIDATVMNIQINGAPAFTSTLMPNSGAVTTGTPWTYLQLDLMAIYFKWSKAVRIGYFGMSKFEPIGGDYSARVAKILDRGQLMFETFATSGIGVNGETF